MQNAVKLDEIDHKIMNLLYENARISVSEIGRIISMTQPAVKDLYRISGEFNYMMKVMSDSMDSLAVFLDSLMQFGLSSPLIVLKSEFEEKLSF
ncbi:AsnC family transcriptional regulator [Bacillus wiedmannii]|uniref:AsnC family transcriptional regulator n=1 Tax=Bacillus wiedmannii TaxID=1890302 RepID=UPI003D96C2CE